MTDLTIFALMGVIRFECEELLGIYTTEEDARTAYFEYLDQLPQNENYYLTEYDFYHIQPMVIGAPVITSLLDQICLP